MNRFKIYLMLIAMAFVALAGCKDKGTEPTTETSTLTYNGYTYKTIKIGSQWWLAENLRTTKYNDETPIANITDCEEWVNLETGAYCWYNNDESYGNTYGALYNWYAVNTRKLAPAGWHVATEEDIHELAKFLMNNEDDGLLVGGKLKETGSSHWQTPNSGATNEVGFSALPGGFREYDCNFDEINTTGIFWTSTLRTTTPISFSMQYDETFLRIPDADPLCGFSVRLVKDK